MDDTQEISDQFMQVQVLDLISDLNEKFQINKYLQIKVSSPQSEYLGGLETVL